MEEDPDVCPSGGFPTAVSLLVLFGLLLLTTLVQIVRIRMRSSLCGGQLILHSMLVVSIVARFATLALIVDPNNSTGYCPTLNATNNASSGNALPILTTPASEKAAYIVSLLPTLVFFSVNSFLILTWTKIYFSGINSDRTTRVWIKGVFITTNAICAAIIIIEIIFVLTNSRSIVMSAVANLAVVLLFLALGIAFPVLGAKVKQRLANVPIIQSSRDAKVTEISIVTWILTAVFICRSITIFAISLSFSNFQWTEETAEEYFSVYCVLVFLYFFIFEAFPIVTVLWNQRRLPPKLTVDFETISGIGDLTDSLVN